MHQGRSSVMHCFPHRFWVSHHIDSNSNPGMTLEESNRLLDSNVPCTITLLKQSKKSVRLDFDRSLLTYIIQHQHIYIYTYIYESKYG